MNKSTLAIVISVACSRKSVHSLTQIMNFSGERRIPTVYKEIDREANRMKPAKSYGTLKT